LGLFITKSNSQVFIPFGFWSCVNQVQGTDAVSSDFTSGTLSNVSWNGSAITLTASNTSGTLTSRVFDMNNTCIPFRSWSHFSWESTLPTKKELYDAGAESGYGSVPTDFSTNLLAYWRFNETSSGTAPGGKDFTDESTTGAHGTKVGSPTLGVAAKLNLGITTSSGNYADFGTTMGSANTSDFTEAAWIKTTNKSAGVIINNRNVNADRGMTLHIGWWAGASKNNGFAYYSNDGPSCEWGAVGNTNLADGNWHHVVGVRSSLTTYIIYVDGLSQGNTNSTIGSGCNNSSANSTSNWQVGRHGAWNTTFDGSIDEVAVWKRALSAAEVLELYRRGGNRIKFQLRSCTASNCSDNPTWLGPDGSNATFFTEINNNSLPDSGLGSVLSTPPVLYFSSFPLLVMLNNRYFQYRATLETDNATYSPGLTHFQIVR
jgi:trimeric autotransporter adhesin